MRVTTHIKNFRELRALGVRAIVLYVISRIVFTVLLVFAILFLIKGIAKASGPYKHSVGVIEANPRVMEYLGENYRQKGFIFGSFKNNGKSGSADFSYKLKGINGISKVEIVASKWNDMWTYSVLNFYPDVRGTDVINLLE